MAAMPSSSTTAERSGAIRMPDDEAPFDPFTMDGSEHEDNATTGCCDGFGKTCPKCGGFMHYQPVYGGYYYECEQCHETGL